MSFFRLTAIIPSVVFFTACAVAEPTPYAQQEQPLPTIIYVSSDTAPQHYAQDLPQRVADATQVMPRVKPTVMKPVPAYMDKTQPSVIRASANMADAPTTIQWNTHIVQPGDTAYSLSRRFCSRTEDIQAYNDLDSRYSLRVGQSILLPRTTC